MAEDLKITIRENIRALLGLDPGESGVSKLIRLGLSNGNAQRLLGGETSVGLDVLSQCASALHVEPWQLCVPGIDPANLPRIDPINFRWPFRRIDPEAVLGLVGSAAAAVETGLLVALASAGISPGKRNGTSG